MNTGGWIMLINNLDDVTEVLNQLERKIEDLQEETRNLPSVVNSIYKKIIKTNKRIEAVETLFNNINEINYIDGRS